jgi:transposase
MRKSFNGLVSVVQNVLQEDPLSDCLFIFFNRRGNYMKLITWDRTGYCLFACSRRRVGRISRDLAKSQSIASRGQCPIKWH